MVTNQGEEAQELSKERRSRWVSAISRDDLTEEILENDRVCEKHFVSGRAAKSWDKYNVDWVPTLLLGHKKATDRAHHKEAASTPLFFWHFVSFSFESILLAGMIVVAKIAQSKVVHQYGRPEMV